MSSVSTAPFPSPASILPFHILAASVRDIPTLAYIHVEALKDDASAAVKFADKAESQAKVEEMLRGQILAVTSEIPETEAESHVGKWVVVKAVVPGGERGGDAKIVGWASWVHEDPASIPDGSTGEHQSDNDSEQNPEQGQDNRRLMTFPRGLGAYVRLNQTRLYKSWHEQHQPPHSQASKYQGFLSLRACFVLSSFQRLGIGKALVEYGCDRADRLMLNTLVTATPAGKLLYERVGCFTVFADLSVDLQRGVWSDGDGVDGEDQGSVEAGEKEGGRWYRFWFLAREFRPRS